MAKEHEWPVQQLFHLGKKLRHEFVHVGDWRFSDTTETAGWFDCDHFDRWI
jgi:hypothetical protein